MKRYVVYILYQGSLVGCGAYPTMKNARRRIRDYKSSHTMFILDLQGWVYYIKTHDQQEPKRVNGTEYTLISQLPVTYQVMMPGGK